MAEKVTGRKWECPTCKFVVKEAAVEHSAVTCNRTQKCRNRGNGTAMTMIPAPKEAVSK
jgi:hypothetical protein